MASLEERAIIVIIGVIIIIVIAIVVIMVVTIIVSIVNVVIVVNVIIIIVILVISIKVQRHFKLLMRSNRSERLGGPKDGETLCITLPCSVLGTCSQDRIHLGHVKRGQYLGICYAHCISLLVCLFVLLVCFTVFARVVCLLFV